jgi:hypothetical protein
VRAECFEGVREVLLADREVVAGEGGDREDGDRSAGEYAGYLRHEPDDSEIELDVEGVSSR